MEAAPLKWKTLDSRDSAYKHLPLFPAIYYGAHSYLDWVRLKHDETQKNKFTGFKGKITFLLTRPIKHYTKNNILHANCLYTRLISYKMTIQNQIYLDRKLHKTILLLW